MTVLLTLPVLVRSHPMLAGAEGADAPVVLFDPSASFQRRLYLSLALDIERIRLRAPLARLVGGSEPAIALRGRVSAACARGLRAIHEMTRVPRFALVSALRLWPTAEELREGLLTPA